MNKELSKGFTGIEINGIRFSNVKEMLIYMNKQRDHIITLEKENAELKVENAFCEKACEGAEQMYKDLKKAKEIIQKLLDTQYQLDPYRDIFKDRIVEAEQFLKDSEKEC